MGLFLIAFEMKGWEQHEDRRMVLLCKYIFTQLVFWMPDFGRSSSILDFLASSGAWFWWNVVSYHDVHIVFTTEVVETIHFLVWINVTAIRSSIGARWILFILFFNLFLILECIDSEDLVLYGSFALHVLYNYLFGYLCLYLLTLENLCNYIFLLCCDR